MLKEFSLPWINYLKKLLRAPSVHVAGTDVDWSLGNVFYKSITADTEFTFSNVVEGGTINFVVRNSQATDVVVAFPLLTRIDSAVDLVIKPSSETFFTFDVISGVVYGTSINNMTNAGV